MHKSLHKNRNSKSEQENYTETWKFAWKDLIHVINDSKIIF